MFKKAFIGLFVIVFAWVLWPAAIDSVVYQPPKDTGMAGIFAPNEKLDRAEVMPLTSGHGPEDTAVDNQGRIYGGLQDGRIIRINSKGLNQETFATIEGGRPLGMHFDAAGQLIVADAYKGLLSFDEQGAMTVLATGHAGVPFAFTNDIDIASDGVIYFTDASDRFNQSQYRLDLLEGRGHGRFLKYDPATQETTLLMDDIHFANGVALSENEDFALVNETARYRIFRYWLKGDNAGLSEIFIDELPGFPDGISANRKGVFWLALPSPRNPLMDTLHPKPFLKNLISKLPPTMQPSAIRRGVVVALDESGEILDVLQDSDGGHVYMVTSVQQVGDKIYMGSLEAPQIARIKTKY